jgi:serine/threonine-protein kinase
MPAKVNLTITAGPQAGEQLVFEERSVCIVGRAKDCRPRIPNDAEHRAISRHHCLLDINPPDIRVRDFGSLNGTFVNAAKIGQRRKGQKAEEACRDTFPEYDLNDGDEVRLGNTVFRVSVFVPALCGDCSREIPEGQEAAAEIAPGAYRCNDCRQKAAAAAAALLTRPARACARCGADVSREMGERRQGEFVCAACRSEPMELVRRLLELARSGQEDLLAIRGYQVLRELGQGNMGAVYLVRHERTGTQIALKIMLPQVALNERARRLFLREIDNTKILTHPHVVRLEEAGCSRGVFFFSLEFCDGGSVAQLMRERGSVLPVTEAIGILLQVLDGLAYAHGVPVPNVRLADGSSGRGKGLVHRDLKPHNIFLCGAGRSRVAKVGDYGLAKAFDQAGLSGQTMTGAVAGTPAFMPRQQVAEFRFARPEVDVWAAGASLYYMLTGQYPRDFSRGRDPWQTVLQTEPVPIRERSPNLPARLAEVIDLALVDQPEIHFKSAADLRRALEEAL